MAKTSTAVSKKVVKSDDPANYNPPTGGDQTDAAAAAAAAEAAARAAEAEAAERAAAEAAEAAARAEAEAAARAEAEAAARAQAEADADAAAREAARAAERTFPRDMVLVNETAQNWVVRRHVGPASTAVIHVRDEDDLHGLRENCLTLLNLSDHYKPVEPEEGEEAKPHALRIEEVEDAQDEDQA